MAETNQNKTNYTNLAENYLYGKISDRKNFYQYYKNDENSIDDPIFTGFTFDIDTLHSPLFYIGNDDTYLATDTLRSESGSNTSLAEKIEKRLEDVYKNSVMGYINTYDLTALQSKDIITNMYRAGYGLQSNVFMDTILYGATDYIYMVDKVTKGTYSDEAGSTDLGNGTKNISAYDTDSVSSGMLSSTTVYPDSSTIIISSGTAFDDFVCTPTTSLSTKKEDLENNISTSGSETNKVVVEHNNNNTEYEQAKLAYEAKLNERDSTYGCTYSELVSKKKEIESSIDSSKTELQSKFNTYQNNARDYLAKYRSNPKDQSNVNNIETLKNDFDSFYNDVCDTVYDIYVNVTIEKNTNYDTEISQLTETDKSLGSSNVFYSAWEIMKSKLNITSNSKVEAERRKYAEIISDIEKDLYGVSESGTALTESNPSDDSLYGQVLLSKQKCQEDEYTQSKIKIDEINQYQQEIEESSSSDSTTTISAEEAANIQRDVDIQKSVDADYANTVSSRQTRETYEVPQTVYDILGFISGMDKLTHKYPYVMQSVTGLDEAYKNYFLLKDPYLGSGDNKITITCYESLDLRVTSMFNKYLNAVYDRQYKRERVPVNLRRFTSSIFVHDIRNFRHALSDIFTEYKGGDNTISKIVEVALNCVSAIEFKFYDCEIVPEETGGIFDSVSNVSAGDMKSTNFTFTYGNCVINFLPFEDLKKYYKRNTTTSKVESGKKEFVSGINEDLDEGIIGKIDNETVTDSNEVYNQLIENASGQDGNYRRWFDRSELGNVNNNDYQDYVRTSTSTAVDDYYRTSMANDFAMNSIVNKNYESQLLDNALNRIITGISASTGIPTNGVQDTLNIGFIDNIINNNNNEQGEVATDLGNVNNKETVIGETTDLGNNETGNEQKSETVKSLGNNETDTVSDGEMVTYIGDTTEDVSETGTVDSIGGISGYDVSDNGNTTSIGKVDMNEDITGTTDDLGDISGYSGNSSIVSDLGNLDGYDVENSGIETSIGNIDGYNIKSSETITDLGNLDGYDEINGKIVNDLGKVNDDNINSRIVNNLGKV